ncbi:MAG: DNA-directed RNA polymerase subunit beta [Cryobacterium sp.]|nr:DNA-directed RNA polymerase subunit beta [Cryobacterium sp.]
MSEAFHKPTKFSGSMFETYEGAPDPAEVSATAHDSARALMSRVRESPNPIVVERLIHFTDAHGIDSIAELWAGANPRTLPGSLWRIYLLRALVHDDPVGTSLHFQRGVDTVSSSDQALAGASHPTGPKEMLALADEILRGMFEGDFAIALDRAAAFCRLSSAGVASIADDIESTEPTRARELTTRALRLHQTATELASCSKLWRQGLLD